jgi:cytochrome c oxidase assembly protein subunit 11
MFGFGFALVPLYEKICEVTGINLLTKVDREPRGRSRNTQVDTSRKIVVEFDANSHGPWRFRPSALGGGASGRAGPRSTTSWSTRSADMAGQAIPSYAPQQSAQYFRKLECFCFKQQALGQRDPALPGRVRGRPGAAARRDHDHAVLHLLRGGPSSSSR